MAKKIDQIPTSTLMTAQTAIEFANREMHGFFQKVLEDEKEFKVRRSYVMDLEKSLETKILKNNKILDEIEKEVFTRIEKMFPGAITSKHLPRIVESYKQEVMFVEKEREKGEQKEKTPVLSLKIKK